jgi:hypothetical protein
MGLQQHRVNRVVESVHYAFGLPILKGSVEA